MTVRWLRPHPYDRPLRRPRLLLVLTLGLAAIAAFVLADRPAAGADAAPQGEFTLQPMTTAPVPPGLAVTCPADSGGPWAWYDVAFGYRLDSPDPVARFDIDYGDGHTFSSSSLDGVFSHRYTKSGTFTVSVTVTTVDGLADTTSCSWHLALRNGS